MISHLQIYDLGDTSGVIIMDKLLKLFQIILVKAVFILTRLSAEISNTTTKAIPASPPTELITNKKGNIFVEIGCSFL